MSSRLLFACALTALATGCDSPARSAAPPPNDARSAAVEAHADAPAAPAPLAPTAPTLPASPSADARGAAARGSNALAFDLYARLRSDKGNLAFSPASITTAVAMAWAGARGETAAEMKRALHFEGSDDALVDAAGSLAANRSGPVTLRVANRLFVESSYPLLPAYTARASAAFGASPQAVDFRHASEQARLAVNAWVAEATERRILDLVPPQGVNKETRLALTNAVYFKGLWDTPFDRRATAPAPFFSAKDVKVSVPMMHHEGTYRFAALDRVKVIDLPYQGAGLVMTLVLPDAVDGLAAVESRLTPALFEQWTAAAAHEKVRLSLPRAEIVPRDPLRLGATLRDLGMARAFDRVLADFSGIAAPSSPDERLVLDEVFHKAFVRVDETGTEAAAATAVVVGEASAAMPEEPPKVFKADHPFLFFIRDTTTKAILFMGRVSDPG